MNDETGTVSPIGGGAPMPSLLAERGPDWPHPQSIFELQASGYR